jgi:hypothetical protein
MNFMAGFATASNDGNYSLLKALNHTIYGIYTWDGAPGDWGPRAIAPSTRPQGQPWFYEELTINCKASERQV